MADNREDFEVWLKSRYDGDAMKAAQADFKRTQDAAKKTDESFKAMGYSADALKQQLTGLLAFTTVVAQFREGFEQVAALEQAMNQLERATKRNGDSFDVVKGKIVGMADALKKAAGVDDDAAIRAMTDLYNATGDVANSMNLVALAADVAVGANKPFEEALQLVTSAAQGKTRALVALKLAQDEDTAATLTAKEALERIQKAYGGATQDAKGLKVEINRLSEVLEDFRNNAVEKLSPALYYVLKAFSSLLAFWNALSDSITSTAPRLLGSVTSTARGMWEAVRGHFGTAQAEFAHANALATTNAAEIMKISEKLKADLDDIWSGKKRSAAGGAGPVEPLGEPSGGDDGKDSNDAKKMVNEWQQEMNRWHQIQGALNLEFLKKKLADEKKHEDAKLALRKHGAKETERIEKQLDAERERLMDAQTQRILDQVRLEKQAAQAKTEMAFRYADAAIGAATAVFGQSKEIAYAEAIINTARAITAASPNVWLMAFAAATGVAQLAKISSTEPGGGADATRGRGFDNPNSDAAARLGGRRWAADMIGEFTGGVREGWAAGMMGSARGGNTTNYDQRRTYNVHLHGAGLIDPSNQQMLLQLKRNLDMVGSRVDSQRTLARAAR